MRAQHFDKPTHARLHVLTLRHVRDLPCGRGLWLLETCRAGTGQVFAKLCCFAAFMWQRV